MANKAPAYQWYPKDILASQRVAEMPADVECWYRRGLDFCWVNGSLPADPARCATIIGKGCTVEGAKWVLEMFVINKKDPTRKIHDRQELERKKQAQNRKEKSKAGKASAEKRRQQKELEAQEEVNSRSTDVENPLQQNPTLQIAVAVASSLPEKKKSSTTPDGPWLDGLTRDPAYIGINVLKEFAKAQRWANTNHRAFTKKFVVNWLNRIENDGKSSISEKQSQTTDETLASIGATPLELSGLQ